MAAAFGDEGAQVVRMVRALAASGATRAGMVAVVDEDIVGHVQLSRSWIDARPALVEVLVLSPLSVTPGQQGGGVGTQLIAAALAEAERLNSPAVFLEGAPGYYGTRGFEPATARGVIRPSVRIPEPAFQVALLASHQDWMTGQLIYPDAFWATDTVGLRDPVLGKIEGAAAAASAAQ